jgi:hypothetical protein
MFVRLGGGDLPPPLRAEHDKIEARAVAATDNGIRASKTFAMPIND